MSNKGVQIARKHRKMCENLPPEEREALGKRAIQIIYAPDEAVRSAMRRSLAKDDGVYKRLAESEAAEKAR